MTVLEVALTMVVLVSSVVNAAGSAVRRQAEGVVSGRVIRPADATGVGDVQVTLIGPMAGQAERALASFPLMAADIAERLNIAELGAVTDRDGRFTFHDLTPGVYALLFRRDGYFGAASPGDQPTSPIVTSTINVTAGPAAPELTVHMIRGTTIRGTVRDAGGNPVGSARVVLVGEFASGRNVAADADGTFTIVAAPDRYKLLALKTAPAGPLIDASPALGDLVSTVRRSGQPVAAREGEDLTIDLVAD